MRVSVSLTDHSITKMRVLNLLIASMAFEDLASGNTGAMDSSFRNEWTCTTYPGLWVVFFFNVLRFTWTWKGSNEFVSWLWITPWCTCQPIRATWTTCCYHTFSSIKAFRWANSAMYLYIFSASTMAITKCARIDALEITLDENMLPIAAFESFLESDDTPYMRHTLWEHGSLSH